MKKNKIGRALLMSAAGLTLAGGFLADLNKTHLFNPRWTPHAKFHDAMTILLGAMLGASGLYFLQKRKVQVLPLRLAAALPAIFWSAQLGSFAFPGAKGINAEFPDRVPTLGPLRLNEAPASIFMLAMIGIGYVLESNQNNQE